MCRSLQPVGHCNNCSGCNSSGSSSSSSSSSSRRRGIGELNTSKVKLRGAKCPREKTGKTVLLTILQSCKLAKLVFTEMRTTYA